MQRNSQITQARLHEYTYIERTTESNVSFTYIHNLWLSHSFSCYSLTGEVPYEEYEVADLVGKINGGYRLPIPEGTSNEMYVALKFSSYFYK